MFSGKLKYLFGGAYRQAEIDSSQPAIGTSSIAKIRAHVFLRGSGSIIVSESTNDLFVKNSGGNARFCERVLAMEIYMLCPQHGFLFQGSDVERFMNWASAIQADTQCKSRMQYQYCRSNGRMSLGSIASAKGNDKFISR